jgi:hypothetical protein
MVDAIAMSSPNGKMSGRASAAAGERLRVDLFGKKGLPGPAPTATSPQASNARAAANVAALKSRKVAMKAQDARYARLGAEGMGQRAGLAIKRKAEARKLRESRAAKPAAPAPAKPTGERIKAARQALARPVPEATRAKVLGAIHSLDNQAATGAPVSVKELRAKLAGDLPKKSQFDRTMRKLTEEGHLTSHRYDNAYAHGTSAAQRAAMVRRPAVGTPKGPGESRRTRESHSNAVSLGPEARKAAAAPKAAPAKAARLWILGAI